MSARTWILNDVEADQHLEHFCIGPADVGGGLPDFAVQKRTLRGGLRDGVEVLDLFTDKTRSGGYLIFYKNSMGSERTAEILPVWEKEKPVERVADFKTLIVYRKK